MFGFLKPRAIREAESHYAQAIKKHQQLRFALEDPQRVSILSVEIVQNCVDGVCLERKYGDAYILAADTISIWAETVYYSQQDRERALELLTMAAFALKEWSTKRYFARNASRGREVQERLLEFGHALHPVDRTFFDEEGLDSQWQDAFFADGGSIFRRLIKAGT